MSELQEKREYYGDRSLKAVYFVDEQGRKQGDYTEYEQNSNNVVSKLEYKDDTVWNGRENTKNGFVKYENGQEVLRQVNLNGNIVQYKDNKVWNGSVAEDGAVVSYEKGGVSSKSWTEQLKEKVKCDVYQKFEEGNLCEENRNYEYWREGSDQTPCDDPMNDSSYDYSHFARFGTRIRKDTIFHDDISETKVSRMWCKCGNAWIDGTGWLDCGEYQYNCKDGKITDYTSEIEVYAGRRIYNDTNMFEPKKLQAHIENGQLTGNYCMPLNFELPIANPSEHPIFNEHEDLRQMWLEMPLLKGDEIFKMEPKMFRKCFEHNIIAEGTWKDGNFTGKAESQHERTDPDPYFVAEWVDGKMSAHLKTGDGEYKWHDGICEMKYRDKDGNTVECTLSNGLREGLYTKTTIIKSPYDWGYCTSDLVRAEYKDGKLNGYYHEYDKETGRLIEETLYTDDKINGTSRKYDGVNSKIKSETQYKNGQKHGYEKIYNKDAHWLESETQYKDGKKHGFEKLYNSDGTVAKMNYYQNGKDCTAKYNKLKNIATKRIEKEKAIEAKTGKKTRLPKMSKLEKTVAMVKENLGLSK